MSIFQFIFKIILTVPVFIPFFFLSLLNCSCSVIEELVIQTIRKQFMEWLFSRRVPLMNILNCPVILEASCSNSCSTLNHSSIQESTKDCLYSLSVSYPENTQFLYHD